MQWNPIRRSGVVVEYGRQHAALVAASKLATTRFEH
jgi:hypothetical protein